MAVRTYHFRGGVLWIPSDKVIHHIDGDPSNNELSNLRVMAREEHVTPRKTPKTETREK